MTICRDGSPVAVVGFSFRMPGGTDETLWQALLAGDDLVTSVDSDRWSQDTLLHPNKSEPGTSYTFAAGSIGDLAGFYAAFFRDFPARSRANGSAAAGVARDGVGNLRAGWHSSLVDARQPLRRLCRSLE